MTDSNPTPDYQDAVIAELHRDFDNRCLALGPPTRGWGWCRRLNECCCCGVAANLADVEIVAAIYASIPRGGRREVSLEEVVQAVRMARTLFTHGQNSEPIKVDRPFPPEALNEEVRPYVCGQ